MGYQESVEAKEAAERAMATEDLFDFVYRLEREWDFDNVLKLASEVYR